MMGKRESENITRRHIEQKKKAMARARRRRFLRRMFALIICTFLLLLSAGAIYGPCAAHSILHRSTMRSTTGIPSGSRNGAVR